MSEPTVGSGTAAEDPLDGSGQTENPLVRNGDWEERLAVARTKREEIQKAKGKVVPKPQTKRPRFLGSSGSGEAAPLGMVPAVKEKAQGPAESHTTGSDQQDYEVGTPFRSAAHFPVQPVVKPVVGSVSRIVTVAFACFFGLGFGMVLSFGVIVSMGWISWSDIAPSKSVSGLPIKAEAPQADTTTIARLAPTSLNNAEIAFRYTALTSIPAGMRKKPELFPIAAVGQGLAAIHPPAPRFDTTTAVTEFAARVDFQAANIAMTFDSPERQSLHETLLQAETGPTDDLFVLPEKSTFNIPTVLASLSPPAVNWPVISATYTDYAAPSRMQTPTLFESEAEEVLTVLWADPEKLVVFDTGISAISPGTFSKDTAVLATWTIDAPPAGISPYRAPLSTEISTALPVVDGPPAFKPNLASRLGLRGDAIKQFSLATFAPTNVSDTRMASNAELLTATGLPVLDVNRVDFTVSKTHVRYYSKEDEAVAQAIAEKVGGEARDFTTMQNPPPQGRVEVWLKGSRQQQPAASSPARSLSEAQRQAALKAQLENRLVNSLRRGDHLVGGSQ